MKSKYLLFFLFLFESCAHGDEKPTFFSFQNRWGVICFFEYNDGSASHRTIFLPLKNPADSISIDSASSIFAFKYGLGMDYYDQGQSGTNYKIYWISDHKKFLSEKDYKTVKVYWAFAKLKYHRTTKVNKPLIGRQYNLTLFDKDEQIQIEAFSFNKNVVIDTAYFKRKYFAPIIDTATLKLKVSKPRPGNYL